MKRFVKILIPTLLIIFLTGCWNNSDLTKLDLVVGVAIDKGEDKEFELTSQIIKPEALQIGSNSASSESKAVVNVSTQGKTIMECSRNLLTKLTNRAYFSHVQAVILSEEIAREGIGDYFDIFERNLETRRRAYFIITKDIPAKSVLECESQISKIPATHVSEGLKSIDQYAKSLSITIFELVKDFDKKNMGIVVPIIYSTKIEGKTWEEDLKTDGSAVIKKGKLIGFLDPLQTRGYVYAKKRIINTAINVDSPKNSDKIISINLYYSNGKVKAEIVNGKPKLSILVKAQGDITEMHDNIDITEIDVFATVEKKVKKHIENEILNTVKVSQSNLKCDIYGFIDYIYKNDYDWWKENVDHWEKIYQKTPIEINVDFSLKRTGLVGKAAKPR